MIRNYLKVYLRNLFKNKLFVLINVLGLSIGISACLLVYNYVAFHRSFDKMHDGQAHMYRVITESYVDGKLGETYGVTMQFLGPELRRFSEVKEVTRLIPLETMLVYTEGEKFHDQAICAADSTFLTFFGFRMLDGDPAKALSEPFTTVLTERAARRIFGNLDVVGKTLSFGLGAFVDNIPHKITGVVADPPVNTHLAFDILTSGTDPRSMVGRVTIFNGGDHTYHYPFFNTYLRLTDNADAGKLQASIQAFLRTRIKSYMEKYGERKVYLQPLGEVHLGPKYKWGLDTIASMRSEESSEFAVRWVGFAALVLLVFSIFNFINLSLINYTKRGKELELRRVFGAQARDFLTQFFNDAVILVSIAAVISVILLVVFKQAYYTYLGLPLAYSIFDEPATYLFLAAIFLGILLLKVVFLFVVGTALRLFRNDTRNKEVPLSKYLVILQYMGAFILVNLTIVLQNQLKYMLAKDLGYSKEQVFVIRKYTMGSGANSLELPTLGAFKDELLKNKDVKSVCLSSAVPGLYHHSNQRTWLMGGGKVHSNTIWIDKDYVDVYGLKLLAGRPLTRGDQGNVLINKALMKAFGVDNPQAMIGKSIYIDEVMAHHMPPGAKVVVGVLDDYHQEPLNKSIEPTKFHFVDMNRGFYSVRMQSDNYQVTLDYTKQVFEKFFPGDAFNHFFLDEFIDRQYRGDIQFKELINIASLLSLLIASLGIMGLITYSVQVHRKGIAIRRILGSSTMNIFVVFLRKYLIYFALAICLSFPIVIFLSNRILNSYAYRIQFHKMLLLVPALPILAVILAIIGMQVLRATVENPVRSLRAD